MQAEEFYKHIQQKVEESSFEPTWNKSDVWQRIEEQKATKKPSFLVWKAAAAAIVLLSMIGIMLYKNQDRNKNTVANMVSEKPIEKILPVKSFAENNNLPKQTDKIKIHKKSIPLQHGEIIKILPQEASKEEEIVTVNDIRVLEEENPILDNKSENLLVNEAKVTENEPTNTTENKQIVSETNINNMERKKPVTRERIAILEIPDDIEMANIPQEPRRKNFTSRLKRTNKNRSEQEGNLPSMTNKPNKVWAFLKESLRNETMSKDSTE